MPLEFTEKIEEEKNLKFSPGVVRVVSSLTLVLAGKLKNFSEIVSSTFGTCGCHFALIAFW